jgi:hypothetical protein
MTTNYPGALDTFVNPTATDTLNSATVPHAQQHDNLNDAVLAIETELGTNPKGASATVKERLDSINPAAGQVQGTSRGFFGASAASQTAIATNPMVIAKDAGATYVQVAAANSTNTGSADFAAYGDNGTDASGWVDMGFTGSGFNDVNYTITGKNDGYIFAKGVDAAGLTGNLVLATGAKGTNLTSDIVFATGGFLAANEKARLVNATGQFQVPSVLHKAGTATLAPAVFTAGTNLTTSLAGAVEYDGKVPYFTHESTNRGVIASEQFAVLTSPYTTGLGTANTLKQTFNASTNGAVTVAGNTTYFFECMLNISAMSATAGTLGFGFLGTATYSRVQYLAIANKTALTVQTASSHTVGTVATNTVITASNTTTTAYAYVSGVLVIGAGGTIIPATSASIAAAYIVAAGSYFRLRPIGSNTVTTVGNWS